MNLSNKPEDNFGSQLLKHVRVNKQYCSVTAKRNLEEVSGHERERHQTSEGRILIIHPEGNFRYILLAYVRQDSRALSNTDGRIIMCRSIWSVKECDISKEPAWMLGTSRRKR